MRKELEIQANKLEKHMAGPMRMPTGSPWRQTNLAKISKDLEARVKYLQQEIGAVISKSTEEDQGGHELRWLNTNGIEREAMNIAALAFMVADICDEDKRAEGA